MSVKPIIEWLLSGDVALQYQVYRDLLHTPRPELQQRIPQEGWGARLLSLRNADGHWGAGFYSPKWISSHYTLLELRFLELPPDSPAPKATIDLILAHDKGQDGGVNPSGYVKDSDVCINGMFLNYASYFKASEDALRSIVDFILQQQLHDGGFNCQYNRKGAVHSSLHSTLSLLEGIREYAKNGYTYRFDELCIAEKEAQEFILLHKLFRSHRSGDVIDKKMLMLSYPSRWKYDILRALDYFRYANAKYDPRMQDAMDILVAKRRADMTWPLQAKHPGLVHFDMEKAGQPSRWNTLRALRVLQHFNITD